MSELLIYLCTLICVSTAWYVHVCTKKIIGQIKEHNDFLARLMDSEVIVDSNGYVHLRLEKVK